MENNEILLEEDDSSILSLTGDNGETLDFEYLDCIEYEGTEYLVLTPVDEPGQLVIMRIEPVDEENENYLAVEDDATLDAVYAIFKERYEDSLTFVD